MDQQGDKLDKGVGDMLDLKALINKILQRMNDTAVVERSYSSISVPSTLYVKIDELSNRIDTTKYELVSMTTKGWSGVIPMDVVLGSNGNDVYVLGRASGTIQSMGVRYVFKLKI
jgi:hypothetical protein